ncbi:hypothetical protein PM082_023410 [Marasmius tenuissimus]|nr:hypothetical protein PM082_023410 [Marasmius tenuissimus]
MSDSLKNNRENSETYTRMEPGEKSAFDPRVVAEILDSISPTPFQIPINYDITTPRMNMIQHSHHIRCALVQPGKTTNSDGEVMEQFWTRASSTIMKEGDGK